MIVIDLDINILVEVVAEYSGFMRTNHEYIVSPSGWTNEERNGVCSMYIGLATSFEFEDIAREAVESWAEAQVKKSEESGLSLDLNASMKDIIRPYMMQGIEESIDDAYAIYAVQEKENHEIGE